MGRLIINNQVKNNNSKLNIDDKTNIKTGIVSANSDSLIRKKRSEKYVQNLSKLDSGEVCLDNSLKDELLETIKEEFGEIEMSMWPHGIVAKCYLGDDYEVHTLDVAQRIVMHYKNGESLPAELEKARNLANNKNYAFVEVYSNMVRVISNNGSVSEIKI